MHCRYAFSLALHLVIHFNSILILISFCTEAESKNTRISIVNKDIPCYGEVTIRCTSNFSLEPFITFYYQHLPLVSLTLHPQHFYPDLFELSMYHTNTQLRFIYLDLIIRDVHGLNNSQYSCEHYDEARLSTVKLILPDENVCKNATRIEIFGIYPKLKKGSLVYYLEWNVSGGEIVLQSNAYHLKIELLANNLTYVYIIQFLPLNVTRYTLADGASLTGQHYMAIVAIQKKSNSSAVIGKEQAIVRIPKTKIISDFLIVSKKLQSDGKAIVKMKLNIIPTDTELVLRITVNGSNRTQNFDFNIIKHEMAQSITLTINSKRMSTTLPQQVSSMKLFI